MTSPPEPASNRRTAAAAVDPAVWAAVPGFDVNRLHDAPQDADPAYDDLGDEDLYSSKDPATGDEDAEVDE